jgi:glutamyl-tRNA synthetase
LLRFAPSPTGDMHIGNLRVAILNHILSKQLNEDLVVRIEDTDKNRNIEGKYQEILKMLELFSIDYKGVVLQSDNIKYHTQMAMQLLIDKKAFNCFCSNEALQKDKDEAKANNKPYRYTNSCTNLSSEALKQINNVPFTVRMKKPKENIKFTDGIKGNFDFSPFDIDSFIILRQDKTSTYNFACSVDDMIFDISTVIRGEDHLSNTPKQIYIRNALGYDKNINYIHLPMILDMQTGKKMSKRDMASSVHKLVDEGYLPVAIANYLVLLGYNPPVEIFTLEEAVSWFDINKISKSNAKFDIDKLKFINREHIKIMDEMRLSKLIGYADEDIGKLAKIYTQECDTINQIKTKIDIIFSTKKSIDKFQDEYKLIKQCLQNAPFIDDFTKLKEYIIKNTSLKNNQIVMPLRYALTGSITGPTISEIYPHIKNYLGEII